MILKYTPQKCYKDQRSIQSGRFEPIVINGVITHINGRKYMGNWGERTLLIGYPKGKGKRLPTIRFQVQTVRFREGDNRACLGIFWSCETSMFFSLKSLGRNCLTRLGHQKVPAWLHGNLRAHTPNATTSGIFKKLLTNIVT